MLDSLIPQLTRPINKWNYNPAADLAELAGCLRIRVGTKTTPFVDGNKRIAFNCDSLVLAPEWLSAFLRSSRRKSKPC